jgi:hypothetical protein
VPVGGSWEDTVQTAISQVDAFVILVAPGDENNRWLQYEVRKILTRVWSGDHAAVAVIAPAVAAIPSALRHQTFVTYFPHDEIRLERWSSEPETADAFVGRWLGSTESTEQAQLPLSEAEIARWRNAVVHLGRELGPGPEEKQRLLDALRIDLRTMQWDDEPAGPSAPLEAALQRAVLAQQLGDSELATAYFNLAFDASLDARPHADADFFYASGLAALGANRVEESADAFRSAALLNEAAYGQDDPRTIAVLHNLGLALSATGNHEGASHVYRIALAASQRVLGSQHPQTASTAFNLAKLRSRAGDVSEAMALLLAAEHAYEQVTPAESAELAAVRSELNRLSG